MISQTQIWKTLTNKRGTGNESISAEFTVVISPGFSCFRESIDVRDAATAGKAEPPFKENVIFQTS